MELMMNKMRVSAFSTLALVAAFGASTAQGQYSLTILHHNDGENGFFADGAGFGGVGNWVTTMGDLRTAATGEVITVSAGDQILPGTALDAAILNGQPYFQTIAHYAAGFDVLVLGNHEFDKGTAVTADYVSGFGLAPATSTPGGFSAPAGAQVPAFVNSNLDFSADANLSGLPFVTTSIINSGTKNIGIIGLTTPSLSTASSPGPDVALVPPQTNPAFTGTATAAAQTATIVNALSSDLVNNQGADNVIVVGHLQGLTFDTAMAASLTNVDAIVAAGGGEFLADAGGHNLIPGDAPNSSIVYGQQFNGIPVVTTPGGYNYVGQLVLDFDVNGDLIGVDTANSGLQAVDGNVVTADPYTVDEVETPIAAAIANLANIVVATSQVDLDSRRSNGLSPLNGGQGERIAETNWGNVIADAHVARLQQENIGRNLGITETIIGIMNGGGIRQNENGQDAIIPAGNITALDVANQLPFGNELGYFEGITVQRLVDILENGVAGVDFVGGAFPHVSGIEFTYDLTEPAGDRIVEIKKSDGTVLYTKTDGILSNETFALSIFNFLAGGGSGYPLDDLQFNNLFIGDTDVLTTYLEDDLNGLITASQYPEGGEGRITVIPEPTSLVLLGLGGLLVARRRRSA